MSREESGSRQGRNDTGESARGHREDVSNRGTELCESVTQAVKELRTQSVGGQANQAVCPSLGQRDDGWGPGSRDQNCSRPADES